MNLQHLFRTETQVNQLSIYEVTVPLLHQTLNLELAGPQKHERQ